jgi:hypothetical protein
LHLSKADIAAAIKQVAQIGLNTTCRTGTGARYGNTANAVSGCDFGLMTREDVVARLKI